MALNSKLVWRRFLVLIALTAFVSAISHAWAAAGDVPHNLAATGSGSKEAIFLVELVLLMVVGRLLGELLPSHPAYYGEMVWILMVLEQWLQRR